MKDALLVATRYCCKKSTGIHKDEWIEKHGEKEIGEEDVTKGKEPEK